MIRRLIPLVITVGTAIGGVVLHCAQATKTDKKLRDLGKEINDQKHREKFEIVEFLNKDGDKVDDLDEATVVMGHCKERQYSLPFKKDELLRSLEYIGYGDTFYREVKLTWELSATVTIATSAASSTKKTGQKTPKADI